MKNPNKDIIEAGDIVEISNEPYIAKKSEGVKCGECDVHEMLVSETFKGCQHINCRHIIYKKLKGGI